MSGYEVDGMDLTVNKMDADYGRLVNAEKTLAHSGPISPVLALEQWNGLLGKFKALHDHVVGGTCCSWSGRDFFSFGRYTLEFVFPLVDSMGRQRGLISASDFRGQLVTMHFLLVCER